MRLKEFPDAIIDIVTVYRKNNIFLKMKMASWFLLWIDIY